MTGHTISFRERVLAVVRAIPCGEVRTYGEVAAQAGNPQAARAVGAVLHTNYDPAIPCHRVVRRDGMLGGYNRGTAQKRRMLEKERGRCTMKVCGGKDARDGCSAQHYS